MRHRPRSTVLLTRGFAVAGGQTRLMNQSGGEQLYKGMIDATVKTVRNEGVLALYKGFTPIFARKLLWCSSFFLCYEEIRHWLAGGNPETV